MKANDQRNTNRQSLIHENQSLAAAGSLGAKGCGRSCSRELGSKPYTPACFCRWTKSTVPAHCRHQMPGTSEPIRRRRLSVLKLCTHRSGRCGLPKRAHPAQCSRPRIQYCMEPTTRQYQLRMREGRTACAGHAGSRSHTGHEDVWRDLGFEHIDEVIQRKPLQLRNGSPFVQDAHKLFSRSGSPNLRKYAHPPSAIIGTVIRLLVTHLHDDFRPHCRPT